MMPESQEPTDVIIPGDSGVDGYLYPNPTGVYDATMNGLAFVNAVAYFIDTRNPWILGDVFGSGAQFAESLSYLVNEPSQAIYDQWNLWGANTGLAPGAVYVGYDADTGRSWIDLSLNFIADTNTGYQISWHSALGPNDTSGPVIEFF